MGSTAKSLFRALIGALWVLFAGLVISDWLTPAASAAQKTSHGPVIVLQFAGVNLNSAGTDHAIVVPYAKYIVRRVTVTNASTSLAVSAATLGVYTAAAGGGTTVVTATILTGLTGATKFVDLTVALSADSTTAGTLYVRNVIADGGAATADVYVELQQLP